MEVNHHTTSIIHTTLHDARVHGQHTPKAPTFRLQPIQPQPNLHEIQQPKRLVVPRGRHPPIIVSSTEQASHRSGKEKVDSNVSMAGYFQTKTQFNELDLHTLALFSPYNPADSSFGRLAHSACAVTATSFLHPTDQYPWPTPDHEIRQGEGSNRADDQGRPP